MNQVQLPSLCVVNELHYSVFKTNGVDVLVATAIRVW